MVLESERGDRQVAFSLRLAGHREEQLVLTSDQDRSGLVTLTALEPAAAKKEKRDRREKKGKKEKGEIANPFGESD